MSQGDIVKESDELPKVKSPIEPAFPLKEEIARDTDYSTNPYDLRPFVKDIVQAANSITDRLPPGIPLIITIGENHNYPAHVITQPILLHSLLQQEKETSQKFAFGWESACNFRNWTDRIFNLNLSESYKNAADPDGFLTLESFLKTPNYTLSPVSKKELAAFCLNHHISTSFNDIARRSKLFSEIVDQDDSFSRAIIQKYAPKYLGKEIIRSSSLWGGDDKLGLYLSNCAMIENAKRHLKHTEADLYVQYCGLWHLKELSDMFRAAGYPVLSVACMPDKGMGFSDDYGRWDNRTGHRLTANGLSQDDSRWINEKRTLRRLNKNSGSILTPNWKSKLKKLLFPFLS